MTQLLQVLHNVCRFYLDFVKAFDRFHNKLLLKKLHRFGICSCPVDLVRRLSHWPRPKGHRSRSQRPAYPCVIRRAARINTWTSLVPHICDWMTFRWTWRPLFLSLPMTRGASGKWKAWRMVLAYNVTSNTSTHDVISARGWGGTLGISGWGCAAGTLEPIT